MRALWAQTVCLFLGHRYEVLERRAPEGPRHPLIGALARCTRCDHRVDWRDLVGPAPTPAPQPPVPVVVDARVPMKRRKRSTRPAARLRPIPRKLGDRP